MLARTLGRTLAPALLIVAVACAPQPSRSPRSGEPSEELTPVPAGVCDEPSFHPDAPLPAEFGAESLPEDYTRAVVADFLDALALIYDGSRDVDICDWFTAAGWASALEIDWRLRDVVQGELKFRQEHVLRVAFESVNDPHGNPPRLSFDPIYDIASGATTIDARTGAVRDRSTAIERIGYHYGFTFDGDRWRVNSVAQLASDYVPWTVVPARPQPGPPCAAFVADAPGSRPFDESADRVWCDAAGQGRTVQMPAQISLLTRYPCNRGHAAVLTLGRPLGSTIDPLVRWEYVRDPAGEFLRQEWIRVPFDGDATLPPSAAYTGWTNGNIELWVDEPELDEAIYLVRGDAVERWPRAADSWGVLDCN